MLLALLGCDGREAPEAECVAVHAAPIHFGSDEPQLLDLSIEQRSSIGAVLPTPEMVFCTGVVIRSGWVLTAAHCDIGEQLTFRGSSPDAAVIPIIATASHPTLDVMLLELETTRASSELQPIPLWEAAIDGSWIGREVTLAGVGEVETASLGELRFVAEPVVAVGEHEITVDGMGSSGACVGDSGGPILVPANDGSPRVAGILDRGSRSCVDRDVYLRADRLRGWVAEVIGDPGCEAN
jgi:Trypsin